MNVQIENNISRIAEEARGRFFALLDDARSRTINAAGAVTKVKGPVQVVSKLGLKLTATSHKTADKVLKSQTRLVENQIDAFAGRLRAAAKAETLRDLVGTQLRMIPENASRYVEDVRDTFGIIAGAGQEMGGLVAGTVQELRGRKPATPKAAKKTAKKTARKTASKKTAKKTATANVSKKTPAPVEAKTDTQQAA